MTVTPMKRQATGGYRMVAAGGSATIYVYGFIGDSLFMPGVSADQFRQDLTAIGNVKSIDVRINSEGGDVFDAQGMYSLLVQHPATVAVHIDGVAASAASFLAMAGNTIEIAEAGFIMIHNARSNFYGTSDGMRKRADLLDAVNGAMCSIYSARTNKKPAECQQMMDAETWMRGQAAVEMGFADKIVPNLSVAASVRDPSIYRNLPKALRPNHIKAAAALRRIAAAAR